jgi:hypothetical protein
MAKSSSNRQAAKSSATGTATTAASTASTGGRRPGERLESENTTETVENAEAAQKPIALVVVAPNPKRKGTKAFDFYAKYPPVGEMSDFMTARRNADGSERVRGKDISWDADRRHILLGEEAENFPVNGSRDEKAAYLRGLPKTDQGFSIDDKRLIAWGYMDAPVEEKTEAQAEVAQEDATA